jgi:hypothetical protein
MGSERRSEGWAGNPAAGRVQLVAYILRRYQCLHHLLEAGAAGVKPSPC